MIVFTHDCHFINSCRTFEVLLNVVSEDRVVFLMTSISRI